MSVRCVSSPRVRDPSLRGDRDAAAYGKPPDSLLRQRWKEARCFWFWSPSEDLSPGQLWAWGPPHGQHFGRVLRLPPARGKRVSGSMRTEDTASRQCPWDHTSSSQPCACRIPCRMGVSLKAGCMVRSTWRSDQGRPRATAQAAGSRWPCSDGQLGLRLALACSRARPGPVRPCPGDEADLPVRGVVQVGDLFRLTPGGVLSPVTCRVRAATDGRSCKHQGSRGCSGSQGRQASLPARWRLAHSATHSCDESPGRTDWGRGAISRPPCLMGSSVMGRAGSPDTCLLSSTSPGGLT